MRKLYACMLVLFLCIYTPAYAGDEISVIAEGFAAVQGDDLVKAEDEALNDAKRNAVEAAVGVLVRSETLGEDQQLVKDSIISRSEGYVSSWSRINGSRVVENVEGSKLLRIKINAKVSLIKVVDGIFAIPALLDNLERPRIRVMVREDNLGNLSRANTISGDGLTRSLQDKGFEVIQIENAGNYDISPDAVPEILIVGNARSEKQDSGLGKDVMSCVAHFSAKIILTSTGTVLYTAKPVDASEASLVSLADASSRALSRAGETLISNDQARFTRCIIARWADQVQNGRPLTIKCSGITYDEFSAIKELVKNTRGFVEITKESYKDGDAGLLVKSKLSGKEFRDKIAGREVGKKTIIVTIGCGAQTEIALR